MRLLVLLAILVLIAIVAMQGVFQVDETQSAIVTRFGEPVRKPIETPGINFKVPFLETVIYIDNRILIFDAPPSSLLTKDKKNLVIDVYARGKIVDPLLFVQTVATEREGSNRAIEIVSSALREEIALDEQSEIIRTSREVVMNRVRDAVYPDLMKFGIETIDVRIKRADFPGEIAASVYSRMQAERKRIADRERASGAKVDLEVRSSVDRQARVIESAALRDADIVRGCGEAEAIRIFAEALEQDPEFYTFQRSLELYKNYLTTNTTIVGSAKDVGSMFENIRNAVTEAAKSSGDIPTYELKPESGMPVCAKYEVEAAALILLSLKLDVDRSSIQILSLGSGSWPTSGLGCEKPDQNYIQVATTGYKLVLAYDGEEYQIHTSEDGVISVDCTPEKSELDG